MAYPSKPDAQAKLSAVESSLARLALICGTATHVSRLTLRKAFGPPVVERQNDYCQMSDVVIHRELERVRALAEGFDFLLRLVPNPSIDHVFGEDISAKEELMVAAQRGE